MEEIDDEQQLQVQNIGAGGDSDNRIDEAMQSLNAFANDREILETEIDNLWHRYTKNETHMTFLRKHFPAFDALHLAVIPIGLAISISYFTKDLNAGFPKKAVDATLTGLIITGVLTSVFTYLCMLCKINDFFLSSKTCSCRHHEVSTHEATVVHQESEIRERSMDESSSSSEDLSKRNSTEEMGEQTSSMLNLLPNDESSQYQDIESDDENSEEINPDDEN